MGKPRMIILIRHAQSEGNKNLKIHQEVPDHRVKLTPLGRKEAEDAGRRLRSILRPDDSLLFFTSPYRRTRETTQGILSTLTDTSPNNPLGPSSFRREDIRVYEEPRLREQDFGNFQPCAIEMERVWQERADYGHFFYRIPLGESAADAYDRVCGFNESLWRQFSEENFPSVCIIVTHGLMTRIFLMKWYHWSVEYFEDLRNIDHCEFIVMRLSEVTGKYVLENEMRTWSQLKREQDAAKGHKTDDFHQSNVVRRWGGCINGCNHALTYLPYNSNAQSTGHLQGNVLISHEDSSKVATDELSFVRQLGRDFGGSQSGLNTPYDVLSTIDENERNETQVFLPCSLKSSKSALMLSAHSAAVAAATAASNAAKAAAEAATAASAATASIAELTALQGHLSVGCGGSAHSGQSETNTRRRSLSPHSPFSFTLKSPVTKSIEMDNTRIPRRADALGDVAGSDSGN